MKAAAIRPCRMSFSRFCSQSSASSRQWLHGRAHKANLLILDYRPLKGSTMNFIKNLIKEEDGVTAIEYALIASLIAGVIIATVTTLGSSISGIFKDLTTRIKAA
jgi:pilus assembly protein Flp/PilA